MWKPDSKFRKNSIIFETPTTFMCFIYWQSGMNIFKFTLPGATTVGTTMTSEFNLESQSSTFYSMLKLKGNYYIAGRMWPDVSGTTKYGIIIGQF